MVVTLDTVADIPLSGDPTVDGMFADTAQGSDKLVRWAPGPDGRTVITYDLHSEGDTYTDRADFGETDPSAIGAPFTAEEAAYVEEALARYEAVANVDFVPDAVDPDLRFLWTSGGTAEGQVAGFADPLALRSSWGPIDWVGVFLAESQRDRGLDPEGLNTGFFTLIHELGHAVANFADVFWGDGAGGAELPDSVRDHAHTVMAYTGADGGFGAPTTLMPLDIRALQYLYGPNETHNAGDDTYTYGRATYNGATIDQIVFETIYDTGGTDTLDFLEYGGPVALDLAPGASSHVSGFQVDGDPRDPGFAEGDGTLAIAEGVVIENVVGSQSNDRITGNAANNELNGYLGHDYILGGEGDDRLIGHYGDDTIEGGAGTDTAVIFQRREQVEITGDMDSMVVTAQPAPAGDDTASLSGVERLEFYDGTLAFDIDGTAGQAYRLYEASLGRAPDAPGLGFWVRALDGPLSLAGAAQQFIASDEFAARFGEGVSDEDFIALVYQNVLDRTLDQQGFTYWKGRLDEGMSRADLLVSFSESGENKAALASDYADGIWFT